jgi:SPX domain protein involved in polyphosphate accumulation
MRYELKYFVPEKDLLKCQAIVLQHPASFSKEFPDRDINNIYLDSPDLISYAEGQSGISRRRKFRIRWYGPWDDIQDPVLEIKIKENQLGTKEHQKLTSFQISDLAGVLEDLRINHSIPLSFGPSSLNRYRRSYFRSFCGKFRITIDRNLMFGLAKSDIKRPSIPSGLIVLELKYEASDDDQADWIRQFIPLQRAKFSKYLESFM